ncbi:unnamed protein product, partial [Mesorhabditis belari]|uniref:Uncharacterized protein n=1 Tax=Mesorhabditis belari TaxID=2138241 RepID=A0AAF3EFF8_9BILA
MPSNLGFRIDLSCSIQPPFDPQMTRATEQLLLPPILPLDRELCVAMNRIEQLMTEIRTYETYETTIERMEKRLTETMKHLNARIREVSDQIKELEREWISELNAHEKRIKKRRVQLKRLGEQEQKNGTSTEGKNKRVHNDVKKKDKETEVCGVCDVADNYQKLISSLGSAVSALDDLIHFPEVFGGKDQTEVCAIRASLNDFLTRLRGQLEGQRVVASSHISSTSAPKAAIQSDQDPFYTSPLIPASMIMSRSSSSTNLSPAVAANKNTTSTSLISGSNLVSLDVSKRSNDEQTDATQALTFAANPSPTSTTPLATPPPTPATTSTPVSAVVLKRNSPTESAYVNLPKPDKGGESIQLLPTLNKSSPTTSAEGNKDSKQSGNDNSTLPEPQQEASKKE